MNISAWVLLIILAIIYLPCYWLGRKIAVKLTPVTKKSDGVVIRRIKYVHSNFVACWSIIVFFVFIGVLALLGIFKLSWLDTLSKQASQQSTIAQYPTPTFTEPTSTPLVLTPTSYSPTLPATNSNLQDCIHWDKVTIDHVGKNICVYGTMAKIYNTDQYAAILRFSIDVNTFLLRGQNIYYPDIKKGDCIAAVGVVKRNESYMYLDLDYGNNTKVYTYSGCY